jgi:Spx/MgsR family transcriptional regulator
LFLLLSCSSVTINIIPPHQFLSLGALYKIDSKYSERRYAYLPLNGLTIVTTLYGIPNCDTVKKAQKWLATNNINYIFHDYRKDGLDDVLLQHFLENLAWTDLLNKRSTSFRALSVAQKESLNEETAIPLFIEFPTLIKRPLLISNSRHLLGFKAETYQTFFAV